MEFPEGLHLSTILEGEEPCDAFVSNTYDSIEDLGGTPSIPVIGRGARTINGADIGMASKTEQWQISGHGQADGEAFRHWDEDEGVVSGSCSKCHTTPGFEQFAMEQSTTEHLALSAVDCWSCHNEFNLFADPSTRWQDLTTNPALDPMGKIPEFKFCAIKLEAA